MHVNAAGTRMIILGNRRVAEDLLDRNAAKTSGRVQIIMGNAATGGLLLPFMAPNAMYACPLIRT